MLMPASSANGVLTALAARDQVATLAVIGAELGLLVALAGGAYLIARWLLGRLASFKVVRSPEAIPALRRKVRAGLLALSALLAAAIVAYNGWLIARGADVPRETVAILDAVTIQLWTGMAIALGKLTAAAIGVALATRVFRRVLRALEAACNRWDQLRDNDRSLSVLFAGVNRGLATTGWLLVALYGLSLSGVPEGIRSGWLMVIRAYVVIALGLLVVRSSTVIVDTLDGLSHKYAHVRGWLCYYDHLRPLVPTFRLCLEYALWVALASLVVLQLEQAATFAVWGPKLIQAIVIFFLGRVAIELGRFEIGRRLLPPEGLDEMTRRRRATMAPLVRSAFTYAVYFGTAVLILAALGFNPMPFLAGAGILGLVIGFGAQSLINDVVSGFFILFENTYLVGDVIEAAGGKGVVEAIEFRTTKIRDGDGRVHIIRNGDVKDVVNYSRDYTVAVVAVDIAYDADLRGVFSVLREAGERVRAENADVLAATEIDGITAFGATGLTIRTSTRVKPGRHDAAAAALRFSIKETFDRRALGTSRRGLVPVEFAAVSTPDLRDRRERRTEEVGRGLSDARRPESQV
jgi:small-conductance mechanosensitive channel